MGISDLFRKRDQVCTDLLNKSACSSRLIQRLPVKKPADPMKSDPVTSDLAEKNDKDPGNLPFVDPNRDENDLIDSEGTSGQKWIFSFILGFFFLLISSYQAYLLTGTVIRRLGGMKISSGGPTLPGLLLHTAIFILIVRLLLW